MSKLAHLWISGWSTGMSKRRRRGPRVLGSARGCDYYHAPAFTGLGGNPAAQAESLGEFRF
jgi:hypothetical protein